MVSPARVREPLTARPRQGYPDGVKPPRTWRTHTMTMTDRNATRRAVRATDKALDAFWASIAADYPEATTGDLPPGLDSEFAPTAASVVAAWVTANVPAADACATCGTVEPNGGLARVYVDSGRSSILVCNYAAGCTPGHPRPMGG